MFSFGLSILLIWFQTKWTALCDSDSSEGEVDNDFAERANTKSSEDEQDIVQPTQYKKKSTRKKAEKEPKKVKITLIYITLSSKH